jgi:hypothetical protein
LLRNFELLKIEYDFHCHYLSPPFLSNESSNFSTKPKENSERLSLSDRTPENITSLAHKSEIGKWIGIVFARQIGEYLITG